MIVVADRLPARLIPGTPLALDIHVVNDLRNRLRNAAVDAEISWAGSSHRWRFEGDVDPDTVHVGMPVRAVFHSPDEGPPVLRFGPA